MAVRLRTGHIELDDGFHALIEWKWHDQPAQSRYSDETFATASEAVARAERMARIFGRMLDAAGYTKTMGVPTN